MPKPVLTKEIVYAAAADAAQRSMRAAGRTAWNEDDRAAADAEMSRLVPTPEAWLELDSAS